jgi:hypothetical protein
MSIPVEKDELAAIGKIVVHSAILEREVVSYIVNLGEKAPRRDLTPKLMFLRDGCLKPKLAGSAWDEVEAIINCTIALVRKRNTVVHGLWAADPAAPRDRKRSTARSTDPKTLVVTVVSAKDAEAVGENLRNARMLLLHRLHDHWPAAAGGASRPKRLIPRLRNDLGI